MMATIHCAQNKTHTKRQSVTVRGRRAVTQPAQHERKPHHTFVKAYIPRPPRHHRNQSVLRCLASALATALGVLLFALGVATLAHERLATPITEEALLTPENANPRQKEMLKTTGDLLAALLAAAPHTPDYERAATTQAQSTLLRTICGIILDGLTPLPQQPVTMETAAAKAGGLQRNTAQGSVTDKKTDAPNTADASIAVCRLAAAMALLHVGQAQQSTAPVDRFGVYEGAAARAGYWFRQLFSHMNLPCYAIVWQGTRDVCSPLTPDTSGLDFAGLQDAQGVFFVTDLAEQAAQGGGFSVFRQKTDANGNPVPQGVQHLAYAAPLGVDHLYVTLWVPHISPRMPHEHPHHTAPWPFNSADALGLLLTGIGALLTAVGGLALSGFFRKNAANFAMHPLQQPTPPKPAPAQPVIKREPLIRPTRQDKEPPEQP